MAIIVNASSMIPIYEQIADQIKKDIWDGKLKAGDPLPSVRSLAKDLKISALTVKKSYDYLEASGIIATVHGKGSYVNNSNKEREKEEQRKEIESSLEKILIRADLYGITIEEVKEMLTIIAGE